ncbi:MinD/ParA family protein [Candidatus Berkiella aquae]|nr:MinD/ParA family protein [Candidatus Berkiella aquae]
MNHKIANVIAITGGKGGIGKTTLSVNLGIAIAQTGKKTYLLDADFGLSNVDVMLGLKPQFTLLDVIENRASLAQIIIEGPAGLHIIPGASGFARMVDMAARDYGGIIAAFQSLASQVDTLIIDTAAGISDSVIRFAVAANEIMVVVTDEPTSLADAYALIKLLNLRHGIQRFRIIVNLSSSLYEAKKLFAKLTNVTDQYLNVVLHFLGWVPEDELVRKAIKQQCAVMEAYPSSKAAQCVMTLASQINKLPLPKSQGGQVQFFIEQFINVQNVVQ